MCVSRSKTTKTTTKQQQQQKDKKKQKRHAINLCYSRVYAIKGKKLFNPPTKTESSHNQHKKKT